MAAQESGAGFDVAQQNDYYWYWHRVKLEIQPRPSYPCCDNWYEQRPSHGYLLSGHSYDRAAEGSGQSLLSAHDTPGRPVEGVTALPENQDEDPLEVMLTFSKKNGGKPLIRVCSQDTDCQEGGPKFCVPAGLQQRKPISLESWPHPNSRWTFAKQRPLTGTGVRPQERKYPNLHLNVEELNKEFMVKSEELYDSLMNCHWQPLDTIYSKIPDEIPK